MQKKKKKINQVTKTYAALCQIVQRIIRYLTLILIAKLLSLILACFL